MPSGTDTVGWICKNQVPSDHKVTYGQIVAMIRLQKAKPHRTQLTVGSGCLDYPGAISTPTAKLTSAKCLLNSTISTPDAPFMVSDIKDFYLITPMERYEYMRFPLSITYSNTCSKPKVAKACTASKKLASLPTLNSRPI
jgi:hypothetical protein